MAGLLIGMRRKWIKVGRKVGRLLVWLLAKALTGVVMVGRLLMIIGILMVFAIGGLIVLFRWLILLGRR